MICDTCGADVPLNQLPDHLASHIAAIDETPEPPTDRVRDPIPAVMEDRPEPHRYSGDPKMRKLTKSRKPGPPRMTLR